MRGWSWGTVLGRLVRTGTEGPVSSPGNCGTPGHRKPGSPLAQRPLDIVMCGHSAPFAWQLPARVPPHLHQAIIKREERYV